MDIFTLMKSLSGTDIRSVGAICYPWTNTAEKIFQSFPRAKIQLLYSDRSGERWFYTKEPGKSPELCRSGEKIFELVIDGQGILKGDMEIKQRADKSWGLNF